MGPLLPVLALLAAQAAPAAAPSADELARLSFQNDLLGKQLVLAKGKEFYLLLDPRAGTLKLMYRAALLQQYAVNGLEVGVPRVAFKNRSDVEAWRGRVWENGALDPPRELDRIEVQAPPPTPEGKEIEVQVPPTPEEKYPVPHRYHIRFAGGLSIEIRPPGSDVAQGFWARMRSSWSSWWADATAAMSAAPTDTVRLHLVMSKQDAESLYRALPPGAKLLVLPPL
jgi:hypothetical protein